MLCAWSFYRHFLLCISLLYAKNFLLTSDQLYGNNKQLVLFNHHCKKTPHVSFDEVNVMCLDFLQAFSIVHKSVLQVLKPNYVLHYATTLLNHFQLASWYKKRET